MLLRSSRLLSHIPPPPAAASRRHISCSGGPKSAPASAPPLSATADYLRSALFIPPGVSRDDLDSATVLDGSNIVVGPYAGHAQIKEAQFIKSSVSFRDCPKDGLPELAILGRSNVGKSSLVNMLVRKKQFALTSKKPGRTQLINHFLVDKSWYIVDLPGYGYAKATVSSRTDWSLFTKDYFLKRETLVAVMLLIDATLPPQKMDIDCANWLGRNDIGMTFVFTKCDKTRAGKGNPPDQTVKQFQDIVRGSYKEPPPWIMTSSVTGLGRDGLLLHMSQLRNYWDQ